VGKPGLKNNQRLGKTMRVVTGEQQNANETGIIGRRLAVAGRGSNASPAEHAASAGCSETLPIWLAVLIATSCQARSMDHSHKIRWSVAAGRAVYTNLGRDAERIEPFAISLSPGETLAVCWTAGETAYTLDVCSHSERCA
jgi:hypothetical protein